MPFIAVKGTHDLYGAEADGYAYIENVFRAVSELYGYRPIETPILEYTEVFDRSTGKAATLSAKKCIPSWIKGIVR